MKRAQNLRRAYVSKGRQGIYRLPDRLSLRQGARYANSSGRRRVRERPSRCPVCWISPEPNPGVVVTLFHVLKPMPRGLLEHGGSENPAVEAQLNVQLRDEQEAWIRKERESECHVLKEACETLAQSGFDLSHVAVKYGHDDNIARNILEEARSGHYDTIVVGRQGTSRIKQIFGGGTTDHVLHAAKGFAIWVVE